MAAMIFCLPAGVVAVFALVWSLARAYLSCALGFGELNGMTLLTAEILLVLHEESVPLGLLTAVARLTGRSRKPSPGKARAFSFQGLTASGLPQATRVGLVQI